MRKTLFFDVETTGLDPERHGLVQLAVIIDIDGEVKQEKGWSIKPFYSDLVDDKALKVNGITKAQMETFEEPEVVYAELTELLSQYIDKYDRGDKFFPAGYNVRFDIGFLWEFFKKCEDLYFGSFVNTRVQVDPLPWLHRMAYNGEIDLPNYKLETVCEHFGIKLDNAHDALADIRATRELIRKLLEEVI